MAKLEQAYHLPLVISLPNPAEPPVTTASSSVPLNTHVLPDLLSRQLFNAMALSTLLINHSRPATETNGKTFASMPLCVTLNETGKRFCRMFIVDAEKSLFKKDMIYWRSFTVANRYFTLWSW